MPKTDFWPIFMYTLTKCENMTKVCGTEKHQYNTPHNKLHLLYILNMELLRNIKKCFEKIKNLVILSRFDYIILKFSYRNFSLALSKNIISLIKKNDMYMPI